MRSLWLVAVLAAVSGCSTVATHARAAVMVPDWSQSVRRGELCFNYPKGKLHDNGPSWVSMPGEQWRY